jgi:uncharacterized RDD family membrane protein YckC
MQCQNCEAPILPSDLRCQRCGAKSLHRRVMFGDRDRDFVLTAEEPGTASSEAFREVPDRENWQFTLEDRLESHPPVEEETKHIDQPVQRGGFLRRLVAFGVDVLVILTLGAIMSGLSYIGYKVGLAAYGRSISEKNWAGLKMLLTLGWLVLLNGYFVLFHGLAGKTVGKSLLGLRVVGVDQAAITYKRAGFRWLATIFSFVPLGLGHLWIIWSAEKRGWHDHLARTWVIKD